MRVPWAFHGRVTKHKSEAVDDLSGLEAVNDVSEARNHNGAWITPNYNGAWIAHNYDEAWIAPNYVAPSWAHRGKYGGCSLSSLSYKRKPREKSGQSQN